MLDTFQGLPVHTLIAHATVVIVPLAALVVALAAIYPRFRDWIGWFPPAVAVVAVVLVQVTSMSGDEFYDKFRHAGALSKDIEDHKELGEQLIWFVIPLAIFAVLGYLLKKRGDAGKAVVTVVAVLAVASAAATAVDVALIGHAGAKAVWKDQVTGLEQAR